MEVHDDMERAFLEVLILFELDLHYVVLIVKSIFELFSILILFVNYSLISINKIGIKLRASPKVLHDNLLLLEIYDDIHLCLLHLKVVIYEVQVEQVLRELILKSEPESLHVHLNVHQAEVVWKGVVIDIVVLISLSALSVQTGGKLPLLILEVIEQFLH